MAVRIYQILMWLYPAEHRQAYGELMLQHVRDLERDARRRRGWRVLILCLRMILDGILNAGIEQWEAIMGNHRFTSASWLTVLLAVIPGLLLVVSRVNSTQVSQILPRLISIGYLAILVVGVAIIWVRQRRFPVWALLPAGLLFWIAIFLAGNLLTQLMSDNGWLPRQWQNDMLGFVLLEIGLTIGLSLLVLHGRRLSPRVWLVTGAIVLFNLLVTIVFYSSLPSSARFGPLISQIIYNASFGVLDGLMLIAAGLLAVRQHGTLAMLMLIGGFGYMCMDSDFISGFRLNEWTGYTAYLLSMNFLYLVVTPVALLRARTHMGRALAIFIPLGVFHIARLAIPRIVLPGPHQVPWGDILFSVVVMLNFVLAWVLYSHLDRAMHSEEKVETLASEVLRTSSPETSEAGD